MRLLLLVVAFTIGMSARAATPEVDDMLKQVAQVHGAAGPWAVAGYRMGQRILKELALPRYSFSLVVQHESPDAVQYTCILDGLQAATGASLGKLNLRYQRAEESRMATYAQNRVTGRRLALRLRPEFVKSIFNVPADQFQKAAERVAALPEADIFTIR